MSPKGNKTLNLKCPEKESGTPSLRHVRVIPNQMVLLFSLLFELEYKIIHVLITSVVYF